jgi:MerR family transcriptional regulator, light-induced transcriptional regulator
MSTFEHEQNLAFSIKMASQKSGLSPHVIRIWERRYGAVQPSRSAANRRLYSESDIEKLILLRKATKVGHHISDIAALENDSLEKMSQAAVTNSPLITPDSKTTQDQKDQTELSKLIEAMRALDAARLESLLKDSLLRLGHRGLLNRIIAPCAQELGKLWAEGVLTAAHEHFATAIFKVFLAKATEPFIASNDAPLLVAATPAGQIHELGAQIAASAAATSGWRVIYLGANLPAAEIAGAARQHDALAVALSIVYPPDDPNLPREIENLADYLNERTKIICGGRASRYYYAAMQKPKIIYCPGIEDIYDTLDTIRELPLLGLNFSGNSGSNKCSFNCDCHEIA